MKNRVLENVGALEKGIIILDCNVNAELQKLPPDEARKVKRRYRKLARRVKKEHMSKFGKSINCPKQKRSAIRRILRSIGREKLK